MYAGFCVCDCVIERKILCARVFMCWYMLLTKISRPTGAVGSSSDSEVIAAIGIRYTLADPPPEGALIRWFTDILSALQALRAP